LYLTNIAENYRQTFDIAFKWIGERTLWHKIALSLGFALVTGVMAQIRIPLPFTPVPLTGQVFAVLLSAVFLGGYGALSQLFYVILGIIGIPWFSGGLGGFAVITGLTGGYLIGFIPSAMLVGWFTSRYAFFRKFHYQLLLMMAGVVVIYILGSAQIAILIRLSLVDTIRLAVLPFIGVDLMKAAIVACISTSILPKVIIKK
jgi:biotin transport system substrate-specific component